MNFLLKIITPDKVVLEEEIFQATLPVEEGDVTVLPNHVPYIGTLRAGEIVVRKTDGGAEASLATSGGFVEFHENLLTVLADTAERAEEIDIARAEEARVRAEEAKASRGAMDDEEFARTAAALEKELARIKVARKHHTRHGMSAPGSEL